MKALTCTLRALLCAGAVALAAGTATAQDPIPAPSRPAPARIGIYVNDARDGGVVVAGGTRRVIVEEWRNGAYREREAFLLRGDTIDMIDGVSIPGLRNLYQVLDGYQPGDWIRISGYDSSTGGRERYTARLRLQ
jgi:hypothetical protein